MENVTADDRKDEDFSEGDVSDPAEIHGEDRPGLMEIQARTTEMEFRYSELSDGARMEYATGDPLLVSALPE